MPTTPGLGAEATGRLLVYGAYGYTGRLVVERALELGMSPLLGGRDREALAGQAERLGLEARPFDLATPDHVMDGLRDVDAVLHCAGPFSHTFRPMAEACLRRGVHYLDVTGELVVFEALGTRSAEARDAGVVLLPGVGFDVVPSDCLAAHTAGRLPEATRLTLAVFSRGRVSRGTATTMIEYLGRGGAVRRDGHVVRVPPAYRTATFDFGPRGGGLRTAVTAPFGDVVTAFRSTGIGNIEVYLAMPAAPRRALAASRWVGGVLRAAPLHRLLKGWVRRTLDGPDADQRSAGSTHLWAGVEDASGRRAVSRLHGPEAYTFTAWAAVGAAREVLAGRAKPGFQTPALAFGPEWPLDFEGVEREDVE